MSAMAIITARGGSKRIPRKNIKEFLGKPILIYSIEAALESGCFDEVMVSTDDEEIAEIAKKAGANVPFMRSSETSNDFATTSDVLAEVIGEYEKKGKTFEYGCCIYPTAPFVTGDKLKKALERLEREKADTVIPVVDFSFPPQRAFIIKEEKLVFRKPEYMKTRSQDLEKWYHDAGQFYCFRIQAFMKTKNLLEGSILPLIVPETEVQDIDTLTDWEIAEMKYRIMVSEK